ncbi:MAG: FtsX-like permease family protein [Lachnospiraceae bacterium]|nr:FtsX-like permease family protein [Lachnospiraceae bacterium]
MSVLWKCCKRNLKENKNRTIVTILGVALATGLITAVACLGVSLLASYTEYVKNTEGDAHVIFQGVSGKDLKRFYNNQSVDQIWIARREGYASIENQRITNARSFIELEAVSPEWLAHHDNGTELVKGRMPEKDHEIALDRRLRTELKQKLQIGDEITLTVGERTLNGQKVRLGTAYNKEEVLQPKFEKTYVIVGFTDGEAGSMSMHMRRERHFYSQTYKAYTYLSPDDLQKEVESPDEEQFYDVSIRYKKAALKDQEELTAGLLGISTELYKKVWINYWKQSPTAEELLAATEVVKDVAAKDDAFGLMHLESGQIINQQTYEMIYLFVLVFLILMYAGVFCINNSFDLTFTERVRFYGLMSSIGTTKRQRRKLVLFEGVVIGAYGIPLGLLIGILFTFILVRLTNLILLMVGNVSQFRMVFRVNLTAFALGAAVSALMIFLSAWESAVRASKVSPIAAIRSNEEIKSGKSKAKGKRSSNSKKEKQKKHSKLIKKLFGVSGSMALRNYERAKIKYRASVTSIALSITLFLGISFITTVYAQGKDSIWEETNCQLTVYVSDEVGRTGMFDTLKSITEGVDGVTRAEFSFMIPLMIGDEMNIPWLPGKPAEYMPSSRVAFLYVLDEESFKLHCEKSGVDYEEARGKGIANCAEVLYVPWKNAHMLTDRVETGESFAAFQKGDLFQCYYHYYTKIEEENENGLGGKWEEHRVPTEVEIAGQADDIFALVDVEPYGCVTVYVGESWLAEHPEVSEMGNNFGVQGCYLADDVNALEEALVEADIMGAEIDNFDKEYRKLLYTEILIKMFLCSFMFIISMIGITNVINAIGTNMELRSHEFARLRSIGMTGGQLRQMVRAEMLILGGKGMLYGVLIGTGISYALYRFLWESSDKSFDFAFRVPVLEIVISIAFVSILLAIITERRIRKMERRNIVETLRNENQ